MFTKKYKLNIVNIVNKASYIFFETYSGFSSYIKFLLKSKQSWSTRRCLSKLNAVTLNTILVVNSTRLSFLADLCMNQMKTFPSTAKKVTVSI